jgi:hypothetical protein
MGELEGKIAIITGADSGSPPRMLVHGQHY